MAGLGLGLGISSGVNGPGHSPSGTDFLYLLAQDGDVLQAQRNRGDDESPALILYEPNDVTSDAVIGPTELILTQDGNFISTQDGRLIGIDDNDLPFARYITQDGNQIITQDGQPLVAQEVNPDSTIQEFITQNGRFLFTQSGDQLTTT
jgi:hypothetical protein